MNKKKTRYIVLEGTEGIGKTTQTQKLVEYLRSNGYSVLSSKEPGTSHLPLTMRLREIMLSKEFDDQLTVPARELISQAIRSVHLEKLIAPAFGKYDFIIQDRGMLSGLAYGIPCGNDYIDICNMLDWINDSAFPERNSFYNLYSDTLLLVGDVEKGLKTATTSKQEFAAGDAIEAKGNTFMTQVADTMEKEAKVFSSVHTICVDNKGIEAVFDEIRCSLDI